MNSLYKYILNLFGLDNLVLFSLSAKILQGFGLIALLFAVTIFLDEIERGFYFSFISFAALQIFFELGIGVVIIQHTARLIVSFGGNLENLKQNSQFYDFKNIVGIFQFNFVWTTAAGILLFLIIYPLGLIFFNNLGESSLVSWRVEWLFLIASVAIFLPLSAQLSFFEGGGYLKEVLKLRIFTSLTSYISAIICLILGLKLFAVSAIFISQILVILIWIVSKKINIYKIMLSKNPSLNSLKKWFFTLLPMQWKISVSWICGYLAFQSATPFTQSYLGAKAAGELGLFLNISNMLVGFIGAWMSTKIPKFSLMIENKKLSDLNILFAETSKKSSLVFLICSIMMFYAFTFYIDIVSYEYVSVLNIIILLVISALSSISYAQAVYLRCFLQELFMISSIVYALLIVINIPIFVPTYGINGLSFIYLFSGIISTFMTTMIFIKFKKNIIL